MSKRENKSGSGESEDRAPDVPQGILMLTLVKMAALAADEGLKQEGGRTSAKKRDKIIGVGREKKRRGWIRHTYWKRG